MVMTQDRKTTLCNDVPCMLTCVCCFSGEPGALRLPGPAQHAAPHPPAGPQGDHQQRTLRELQVP